MPCILLIEDDRKLTELVAVFLQRNGFVVHAIHDGNDAEAALARYQPDLVVLDLMLPGKDGLSVCRELRGRFRGKILMLTASEDDMDQVAALELGVDDFVCKPLHPRVLLARIRMLLRRDAGRPARAAGVAHGNQLRFGALQLDGTLRRCLLDSAPVNLTPGEFDVLWLLASHPDGPVSREELVRQTRGIEYDGLDRTIDNRVVSLRKKLGDNASLPQKIITVRGRGYLFVPDGW
jgi:two-component system, OmpR family, response regulator RstA